MFLLDIFSLPGGDCISRDFCNNPVRVEQAWVDEPVAAVLLCGRLIDHKGDCDPMPPLSDVQGD
jgi:hypothetical protein